MAIEQGIVTGLGKPGSGTAWVETIASSACESCSSRESCNPGGGKNKHVVEAINEAGAAVGDRIQIAMDSAPLLKATFLLYLFPILCMLIGALLANALAAPFFSDTSAITALAAFACLAAALLIVRLGGTRLAKKASYRPKIIRILGHAATPQENTEIVAPCAQQSTHSQ
jgi:sigma-E factor negative regulatory protein RseC